MKPILFNTVLFLLCALSSCSKIDKVEVKEVNVIPLLNKIQKEEGSFVFNEDTEFVVVKPEEKEIAAILIDKFQTVAGFNLKAVEKIPNSNYILFKESGELEGEAYKINITESNIEIMAGAYNGFLYGVQTLRQLLPVEIESDKKVVGVKWHLPAMKIEDSPRFKWRGLMLDVSRHFFKKEYVKKVIEGLSLHKMNVLHLHLVDDQGWRMEIEKYPKLTEVGAWRVDQEKLHWNTRREVSPSEKGTYGGYFTKDDLREIVAYAKKYGIEVIPEIEMPAHVSSAVASYPYLACGGKPIGVPSGGGKLFTDIYCAGKESTFVFLEEVLKEVMEVFPSKYIHIGGDEAVKTNWKRCEYCVKRMKDEELENAEELQSYFIKRIEKFLNDNGKKLIGWDEILEGGLAPDATVMSWRGVKGGIEAAKHGHDVVMTPGTHCYFDHYQGPQNEEPPAFGGYTPLSKVYEFDPVVDTMTEDEAAHVLGGQANLWSEFITTTSHSEYMIYPRLAALSETLWSAKNSKKWDDFSKRLQDMFIRYDFLDINYSKSSYIITPKMQAKLEDKTVKLSLQNEYSESDIRFILNNDSNEDWKKYESPISINNTTAIKASLFKENKQIGKVFVDTIQFHKAVNAKIIYKTLYSDSYKGSGSHSLVNILRGTKNFHDGKWQAWLDKDMDVVVDLKEVNEVSEVTVGSVENQGPDIYFPTKIDVLISVDGKEYKKVGSISRPHIPNSEVQLKDFRINFNKQKARYIRIKAQCHQNKMKGRGAWLFIDEILID
ncbi:glycoside hydrolase family 20 protein [Tenacibaculum xiamenense]|uniref:glycoside hydrolase family 20 protein n=1 Tax=Tenacibaculum xiamenense TaxID=1261553 RepID=UPI0038961FE8